MKSTLLPGTLDWYRQNGETDEDIADLNRIIERLVVALEAASCSDGKPSAWLNGTPTHGTYWSPDKTTDVSKPSQSGMTFKPSTDAHGEAVLTWCLEASRARTSAPPEKERVSKASEAGWPDSNLIRLAERASSAVPTDVGRPDLHFLHNVKEHATPLATPHAETGLLPRPAMTHKKLAECLVFAAANHLAIQSSEITGKRRETNLVEARWAIWLVMRDGGLAFQQIADQFLMHNGTIQHGVRKALENHGNREKSFRNLLESIRKTIQS